MISEDEKEKAQEEEEEARKAERGQIMQIDEALNILDLPSNKKYTVKQVLEV